MSREIRIGIDTSRANKSQRTGTEWYSYFLIEELKTLTHPAGREPQFILYSKHELKGPLGQLPHNFQKKILSWPLKLFWTQIRLSWEMLVHPPDVLFVPAHTIPILGRCKMVMTVHDVGFRVHPELYSWLDILYHRFSVWWASRFACRIIVPSRFTKNELIKYYHTDPEKIVVIPHGAPAWELKKDLVPKTNQKQQYLLFLGRLEKKKNILRITKAFARLLPRYPALRLVLGGNPGFGFNDLQNWITAQKLQDKIDFLGFVEEARKKSLYTHAAAFVFPTLYEGFGMPVLEAQSLGCPVITSQASATAEVARDSAVLVNPEDVADIARGIEKVLSDNEFRKALVEKGFKNVKKYSWRQSAGRTLDVLVNS